MPTSHTISKFFAKRWSLLWLLVLLPAVITWLLIDTYRWNIPCADDYSFVEFYGTVKAGTATLDDVLSAHNEHRVIFHRLFYTAVLHLSGGSVHAFPAITFIIVSIILAGICLLAAPLLRQRPRSGWFLIFLAALTLYTPAQVYSWQWGFIYANHLPWLALTTAMVLLRTRCPLWLAFATGAALTLAATFSNATALPVWLLIPAYAVLAGKFKSWRHAAAYLLPWFALALAAGAFAMSGVAEGMTAETDKPRGIQLTLAEPWHAVSFVLSLAGGSFGHGTEWEFSQLSIAIGAALLLLFGACCLYLWRFRKDHKLVVACAPWLLLALGSWMSASLIAIGRLTPSAVLAESAHYVLTCMYTVVGLVFLIPTIVAHAKERGKTPLCGSFARNALTALATCALLLHAANWKWGEHQLKWRHADHLQQQASIMFLDILPEDQFGSLYRHSRVKAGLAFIREEGMLPGIPVLPDTRLSNLRILSPLSKNWAAFDTLKQNADGTFEANGFAHLKDWARPADLVILTWSGDALPDETIFQIAYPQIPHDYFRRQRITKKFRSHYAAWQVRFDKAQLPPGPGVIRAYALNYETQRTRQIVGEWIIDDEPLATPTRLGD